MNFKLIRFSGIVPALNPRLLADQFAQSAENIDFESGAIVPTTEDSETFTLQNSSRRSIYLYNDTHWLEWAADQVFVVKGPVPNDAYDRLYWTGDTDYPRMGTAASMIAGSSGYPAVSYRLGVPAPENAPAVSAAGTPDATEEPQSVAYVYTFVTAYGEEGPPSLASDVLEVTTAETVTVEMPSADHPAGNYNFGSGALKRIYRANTGSNATEYQFVAEVPFTTEEYDDVIASSELGEVLPSETWIAPPDDDSSTYPSGPLQGLIPVANGVLAGYTGNRVCFSEPYLPHAWPAQYRQTLDADVVGLAAISNGVVAMTDGAPYIITGVDPSAMTAVRVPLAQACINSKGIVDMGEAIFYPGPDGLVGVTNGAAEVVTKGVISPKQWLANYKPTLIRAFEHEGTYVAFYNDSGTLGGWVWDPRATEAALSTLTVSAEVRGGWVNPKDGQCYIIVGNKIKKYRGSATPKTATWKSRKLKCPKPTSMGWVLVRADTYPVEVKVWADGTLVFHASLSLSGTVYTQTTTVPGSISNASLVEPIMRLPAVVASEWEVQVSGAYTVTEVSIAQSMEELKADG